MFKSRLPLRLARLMALAVLTFAGAVPLARAASLCPANVTVLNPLVPQANMSGLIYFNNLYVAVTTNGLALYSPDGVTWTQVTVPGSPTLNALAASPTEIIAVGGGATYVSRDGKTWQAGVTVSSNTLNAITWTGSVWVVVGNAGELDVSSDGTTWVNHPSGAADVNLQGVVYTGFTFVAVGTNGTITTSNDGVSWITHSSATKANLNCVAYDPTAGNQVLVAASAGTALIESTDDGSNWNTVPGLPIGSSWQSVRWFPLPNPQTGLFIAVGSGESVITSTDGIHWTTGAVTTVPLVNLRPYTFGDVAVNPAGTHCVIVGSNSLFFNSSDFATWAQDPYEGVYVGVNCVGNDGVLGVVEFGNNIVIRSTDGGATFGLVNGLPLVGNLAKNPDTFSGTSLTYSSAYGAYLAVGTDNAVLRSTDGGFTWVLARNLGQNGNALLNQINWVGNMFAAAGNHPTGGQSAPSSVEVSLDGTTWVGTAQGASSENMQGVMGNGKNRLVAVGDAGEVMVSSDIKNQFAAGGVAHWVGMELTGLPNMNSVAFGNGLWVIVGAGGAAFTSPDVVNPNGTMNWSPNGIAGATEDLNSVRFINGIFYAFGSAGDIFMSLDTVSWLPCVGPDASGLVDGIGTPVGMVMLAASSQTYVGTPPTSVPGIIITKQPKDTAGVSGKAFSLSALGSSGAYPVFYQWLHNGVDLVNGGNVHNSNQATLTINPANAASAGNYTVQVSNGLRSVLSQAAKVTINFAPTITKQPVSQHVLSASSMILTVAATGSPTLRYQWLWKGAPLQNSAVIQGTNSKTLRILLTQPKRSGAYSCRVTNPYGSATSNIANVKMG